MRSIHLSPSELTFRAALVGVALLTTSAAYAELKSIAPARVNLAGTWKLNPELSDDPRKLVEEKRGRVVDCCGDLADTTKRPGC